MPRGGAYILISAAGTSSGGLSTDEEDLTKQGEHTETFFIYIFHSFKIHNIYFIGCSGGSGKGGGRGLALEVGASGCSCRRTAVCS